MDTLLHSLPLTPRARALVDALARRILVLDGATGTLLQGFGLEERDFRGKRFAQNPVDLKGDNDVLCLTRPDAVSEVHRRYFEAGADIVTTNTFGANRVGQADYRLGDACADINREGARLARAQAEIFEKKDGVPRWVAGSVGPTNRTASMSPDADRPGFRAVTFDALESAYAEQIGALLDGGVDIVLLETIFDTLNAKAAIFAYRRVCAARGVRVPLMLSATVANVSGRTLSGQTLEAFWNSVAHAEPLSVGLNCAFGVEKMRAPLAQLARIADCRISCHPNAGLPNPLAPTGYDETPEHFAAAMGGFAREGLLNIAGGCCGTTPAHIAALANAVRSVAPRPLPQPDVALRLSGLEAVTLPDNAPFQTVGERTNVMGSPKFRKCVRENDWAGALAVARAQVEAGANIIDVNFDEALLDGAACMTTFLNLLAAEPDIARVPLMLDASHWQTLEAGLKCAQGKCLVNSLSLKEGEAVFLERARLCRAYGAAVVVMAFDENGQATSRDDKVRVCRRAYDLLVRRAGIPPQDIVFDPNVLTVATGMREHDRYALDFIEAIPLIKAACPHARVSGGISNVSFAFRGNRTVREAMHSVFLHAAIARGLDMAIVNAGMLAAYEDIDPALRERVEDALLCRRPDAAERLVEFAQSTKDDAKAAPDAAAHAPAWREEPPETRLRRAMTLGVDSFLEEDLAACLAAGAQPLALIEGPLMDGMKTVGERFGEGKMFLPQVVKSARVMRRAVSILQPHLSENGEAPRKKRGRILIATVKGDVHDIGKNIVSVVLNCNDFDVDDLGVMVPCETIVARARETHPDIVGLSGLITPSLDEMVRVAQALEREGLNMPLVVGGATTGPAHTAVKIAPAHPNAVVALGGDASYMGRLCADLCNPQTREARARDIRETQARLRDARAQSAPAEICPLFSARAHPYARTALPPAPPPFFGARAFDVPPSELKPFIEWRALAAAWGLGGAKCHCGCERESEALITDAKALFKEMSATRALAPKAALGFWKATPDGDDVRLHGDDGAVLETLHFLRRQTPSANGQFCMADTLPKDGGTLGAFAATAGFVAPAKTDNAGGDPYCDLLARAIADRVADACAQWLQEKVRAFWPKSGRPAVGYPCMPDHTEKFALWRLLDAQTRLGATLTETGAINPPSSVAGLFIEGDAPVYAPVGRIGEDQLADYAARKGLGPDAARACLRSVLE